MTPRLPTVLSATALVVALFGSTPLGRALAEALPAGSVGTKQLRNKAVTGKKIAPAAITGVRVKDGSLLAADFASGQLPAGAPGAKGDKGDPGAPGPPGLSEYEVVTGTSASTSVELKSILATCPSGKRALGGGAFLAATQTIAGAPVLTESHPTTSGTIWVVSAHETGSYAPPWSVRAYAICARVAP